MQEFDKAVDKAFEDFQKELHNELTKAGEAAVRVNRENGNYRDRTGHLRASNYYEVEEDGLEIGNDADYAANVEARGYMVCSEGALLAEQMLNGN